MKHIYLSHLRNVLFYHLRVKKSMGYRVDSCLPLPQPSPQITSYLKIWKSQILLRVISLGNDY